MKLELRPYQAEALDRVEKAHARGVMRQLGVAACGTGKTIVLSALAERMGCRTLVLAHRDELIAQTVDKMHMVWPDAEIGVCKAERNEVTSQVVVASVQTLARPNRLKQLLAPFADDQRLLGRSEPFGLVVVDEAHHHTQDNSYGSITAGLGCDPSIPVDWPRPLLFGVTATPDRGDGKGLDSAYDEIVFSYDILWGIRSGYLCDVVGKQVRLDRFNEKDLKVSKGDYEAGAAGRALIDAGAPAAIVAAWLQHAKGRRTISFSPTVAMAQEVADEFTRAGIKAMMVHGGTPAEERRGLLRGFSRGDFDVFSNCGIATEGYDEPRVDCVIMGRPTKSRALFTQMAGRCTRLHPDKTDALILDVVGSTSVHSMVTIPSLFGLEVDEFRKKGERGDQPISELVAEQEAHLVKVGKIRAEEVELFSRVRSSGVAWVRTHRDGELRRYVRPVGKNKGTLVLAERGDAGLFRVGIVWPTDGRTRVLMDEVPLELAQGVGEDFLRKFGPGRDLVAADAAWRRKAPSAQRLRFAAKWHVKPEEGWNAGQLKDEVDARIAKSEIRKAEKARAAAFEGKTAGQAAYDNSRESGPAQIHTTGVGGTGSGRPTTGGAWSCRTCGDAGLDQRANFCGTCGRAGVMVALDEVAP